MLSKARAQKDQAEKNKALKKKLNDKSSRKDRKGGQLLEAELLRDPEDIRLDPKYGGQTEILLKFVPLKCIDESTDVLADTLREWIVYAIVEEDPLSQGFFDKIQRFNEVIAEIESNMKKVPHLSFYDENGKPKPEKEARFEREKLFTKLGEELAHAEGRLDDTNRELKNHIEWRKKMGVHLSQVDIDKNTGTATWLLRLSGTDDAQEIEDLLLQKRNWQGVKLAVSYTNRDPPLPPWAGRGDVPDGKNPTLPNYTGLGVNMLGVRIMRIPSGIGFYRHLDRATASIASDQFGLYYGEYEHGVKSGYGIQINDAGIYSGGWEGGVRFGNGRMDYADGTTLIGNWTVKRQSNLPQTSGFQNPYLDGEPNGLCEVYYADGAYFRGHFVNGEIQGQGEYQSAFNEMMSGNFQNSLLHGKNCFLQNAIEEVYMGQFKNGEIHGFGTCVDNKTGDSYDGYWNSSLRHGRGVTKLEGVGCHRGYYINGIKHGKGSVEYGEKDETDGKRGEMKSPEEPKQRKSMRRKKKKTTDGDEDEDRSNNDVIIDKIKSFDTKMTKLSQKPHHKSRDHDEEGDKASSEEDNEHSQLNEEHDFEFSPFENIYQGYFLGGNMSNQGSIMNNKKQQPSILSRLDKNKVFPIQQVLLHEYHKNKRAEHNLEKLSDYEHFIRKEIYSKKLKIYQQQKHFAKKVIYQEDTQNKFDYSQLENKLQLRNERLEKLKKVTEDSDQYFYHKARVPRLKQFNYNLFKNYTEGMEKIKPDEKTMKMDDFINHDLLETVFSDFEEVRERQRFLKYDLIWQRAEEAFDKGGEGIN
jgi:hypothetical protein